MKYIDFIKYAITNNQYKEWHNNLTISISFIENIKYKHELIIFKDFTIVKVDLMKDFLDSVGVLRKGCFKECLLTIENYRFSTYNVGAQYWVNPYEAIPLYDNNGNLFKTDSIYDSSKNQYYDYYISFFEEIEFNHDEFINVLFVLSKSVELFKEYIKIDNNENKKLFIELLKND